MQPSPQLGALSHDDLAGGRLAAVHLASQRRFSDVLDRGLEGHPQERTGVVVHPVPVHRLDVAAEGQVVADQVEVPVVHCDSVSSEEGHDF